MEKNSWQIVEDGWNSIKDWMTNNVPEKELSLWLDLAESCYNKGDRITVHEMIRSQMNRGIEIYGAFGGEWD